MKRLDIFERQGRRNIFTLIASSLLIAGSSLIASCSFLDSPEKEDDRGEEPTHVTLLYSVNRSTLWRDFVLDADEIEVALTKINDPKGRFLVYCTDSTKNDCKLYEAVRSENGQYILQGRVIREYPHDVPSTHPDRVAGVINEALSLYPDAEYSLFFWGHGTSWTPSGNDHQLVGVKSNLPEVYSYGGEFAGEFGDRKNLDSIEITELSDAIPDNKFRYIWFDCCYMGGIETIYELRDKCDTLVVYPTEVWEYGLPYDLVLPYVYSDQPEIVKGAEVFFDYYSRGASPVTSTVINMAGVEKVAAATSDIFSAASYNLPLEASRLNKVSDYSRKPLGPYYDFRQYVEQVADLAERPDLMETFDNALNEMVLYHAESKINFDKYDWTNPELSGISIHNYDRTQKDAAFYRSLDWFSRVFR